MSEHVGLPLPEPGGGQVTVALAVGGATWETRLVTALDSAPGLRVVRRCLDVAELAAAAGAGVVQVAVVTADLPGLDRDVLSRLAAGRVRVLGVAAAGDLDALRHLERLDIQAIVELALTPGGLQDADLVSLVRAGVHEALRDGPGGTSAPPEAAWAHAEHTSSPEPKQQARRPDGSTGPEEDVAGRLLAVWGPTGAPGRTTVAVSLAHELAALGRSVLLVDADTYGGAIGLVLGLLDEAPGVLAACRAAAVGRLDALALSQHVRRLEPGLDVLTGATNPQRWLELRPAALKHVLDAARRSYDEVVVDIGFGLETDDEAFLDTMGPRRNGAAMTVAHGAEVMIAVGAGDPLGMQRLVLGVEHLRSLRVEAPLVVVNRVRPSVLGSDAAGQVRQALARYAGVRTAWVVPEDQASLDRCLRLGASLPEVAPRSKAREALRALAVELVGDSATPLAPVRASRTRADLG